MAAPLSAAPRTIFSPIPASALQELSNSSPSPDGAEPIAEISDALHESRNSAVDLVIVWGPGQDDLHFPVQHDPDTPDEEDRDLDAIRKHYQKLGLRVEVMQTDGMSPTEMERIKCDWYLCGKLGPHTQALISAHGSAFGPDGKHHLVLSTEGEPKETGAFLSWLRTPPSGLPPGPRDRGWHGIAHIHSCEGGLLAAELQAQPAEWNRGNFIAHAGRKKIAAPTLRSLAFDLCEAISEGRNQPDPLAPISMVAHAMRIAGDTIYCGGADFDAPLKIGAPRNDEQARMATVVESLDSGRHEEVRISGSEKDMAALLAAMRNQPVGPEEDAHHEEKLSNMMLTRMVRARLNELEALQQDYPEAHELAMRKLGDKNASTVAVAWRRWHVEFLREVRDGRACPERLRAYLRHTQRYDYIAPEWPTRIAPVLRENLELLLVALNWDEDNEIHGLRGALSREFAEHPENVARFLAETQDNKDQHALLKRFFENAAFLREAREGRATPESLRRYLEHTVRCDLGDPDWFSRITSVLRGSLELMLVVCTWRWGMMRESYASRQKPNALLNALAREFAAHPEDIARLLDEAQDNDDHHVYLRKFFETFTTGRLTLLQRMDDQSFRTHAESEYITSLEDASGGENPMATYIEERAPELVAEWYRSTLDCYSPEWLQAEKYERPFLRKLLQSSNPDPATLKADDDVVAHNSVLESPGTNARHGEALLESRAELHTDVDMEQVQHAAIDATLPQFTYANGIDLNEYCRW